jgi:hypothetical protein
VTNIICIFLILVILVYIFFFFFIVVPLEGNSNFACAVACTCFWIVCIYNCTIWGIFCQWLQKGFQIQGNLQNLHLNCLFLFIVISCYLFAPLHRILVTASLVTVELLIEWIARYFNFYI